MQKIRFLFEKILVAISLFFLGRNKADIDLLKRQSELKDKLLKEKNTHVKTKQELLDRLKNESLKK